ncbi:MAG: molybdenum cofactor guanylyltransferase [Proteobacteria bacterium]|nr:molybdenum cofactor guanylyltransferase [Pseudomonadota bacterium]
MSSSSCSSAELSALVLAGGKATRLGGRAKHAIVFEGTTILERQLAVLRPLVHEVIVSSNQPIEGGGRVVADVIVDGGPLAGVAAGLAATTTPWLFVVACDLPYLSTDLVLLVRSRIADTHDAVGLRIGGMPEPLVCALRVAAVGPVLAARLAAGRKKASGLLEDAALRVAWLDEAEVRAVDPELRALYNVNRFADLR